jgi:hypothetical protein
VPQRASQALSATIPSGHIPDPDIRFFALVIFIRIGSLMNATTFIKWLLLAWVSAATTANAQGYIESPVPRFDGRSGVPYAVQTGIGFIYGWHCTARQIEIQFDGGPRIPAATGTPREDTASVCGRIDTGFGLTLNFNDLPTGTHTIVGYADGVEFTRYLFDTVSFGSSYVTGLVGLTVAYDFPSRGLKTTLWWQEEKQNFSVVAVAPYPVPLSDAQGAYDGFARISPTQATAACEVSRTTFTESAVEMDVTVDARTRIGNLVLRFPSGKTCSIRGEIRPARIQVESSDCFDTINQLNNVTFTQSSLAVGPPNPNAATNQITIQAHSSTRGNFCASAEQWMTVMAWRRVQ